MPSFTRRLAYAFVGFFVGDAALLLYMLLNAFRVRTLLLAIHMGEPYAEIPAAIQLFALYAPFSFAGWLFVGVPAVLLLPVRPITRWPWLLVLTLGAFFGPLAMVVILLVVSRIRNEAQPVMSFAGATPLFILSILVSTVSFAVYVALLRRRLRRDN